MNQVMVNAGDNLDVATSTILHICDGGPKTWIRRVAVCPVCDTRRRIVGFSQEWYGTTWTCCGCGDSWADGELLPRPFERGWRAKSIAKAKRQWIDAGRGEGNEA